MKVIERRAVGQDWYETETNKTGWESHGWFFGDGSLMDNTWTIVEHIQIDKFGNPLIGIAKRELLL